RPRITDPEHPERRKEKHRGVERNRREQIRQATVRLQKMIPHGYEHKGKMLVQAADYIGELRESLNDHIDKWMLEKMVTEQLINDLTSQVAKLQGE
ncbi:hypothetical protein GQ42DRAFT_105889, partial [Ramicandelaber brevisporus]